jgi:hypothetical protein
VTENGSWDEENIVPGYPAKLTFNASESNALAVVRQVFWNRLRVDSNFRAINDHDGTFQNYVDFARPRDAEEFASFIVEAFWELVLQGVICPGTEGGKVEPPFFRLTAYGKRAIQEPTFQPHDPVVFMQEVGQTVSNPDATVLAYLQESLNCFAHGTFVASAMMLGIASERVFLLICESLSNALANSSEQSSFQALLARNPIKPKLDWVVQKFQGIQGPPRPSGWPEDVDIKISGIFNLIRCERNDLGHPRPSPPSVSRDDVFGYLRMFPSYYSCAELVRDFLANNRI